MFQMNPNLEIAGWFTLWGGTVRGMITLQHFLHTFVKRQFGFVDFEDLGIQHDQI
jgi:hypothetical protein